MLIIGKKDRLRTYIPLFFCLLINTLSFAQDITQINLANEYYSMGDVEKAKDLYEKLSRNPKNIPIIHLQFTLITIL